VQEFCVIGLPGLALIHAPLSLASRHQRRLHVLLDTDSERTLFLAQPSHGDFRQDPKAA
jgi:hypothetical protein